jgi:SOS-response transcriptional repressor LexA
MSPQARGSRDNNRQSERGLDLTIWGISDTELLGIVDDLADENGWSATVDVRMQLGENVDRVKHSGVPQRLSWLRRYGWLERHPESTRQWRLTAMGHALLDNPSLSRSVENALDKLNPAQRLRLTRELAEAGHTAPDEVRVALRRQWQRSLGR